MGRKTLLLNSAHSKYPCGDDGWIQATRGAAEVLAAEDATFICGTTPLSWDIGAYLAGRSGGRAILLVPGAAGREGYAQYERLLEWFDLAHSRTNPLFFPVEIGVRGKQRWQGRDHTALAAAETVCPVSIRPGGRLDALIGGLSAGAVIDRRFAMPWQPGGSHPHYDLVDRRLAPFPGGVWIVHWTRASQGPWPGERPCDFFREMLASPGRYVRSAAATLVRMLRENLIRGSAFRLRGSGTAVSFSALQPGEAVSLMRWRQRFVRYTFEPYGIAIRRDRAIERGARPVLYAESVESAGEDRMFVQTTGNRGDWAREQEWRASGDFPLGGFDPDDCWVLVPDTVSVERFRAEMPSPWSVHALFEG